MELATTTQTDATIESVTTEFINGIVTAIPNVLSGLLFLVLAYITIKAILAVVRGILSRIYPEGQMLIVDLQVVVVGLFLWFGAALALLKIVGLGEVAASLGTAAGFIGLGVAFALKEMIADTVAGVYLLRDQDFNIGDTVNTASVTGTIRRIDLRKTRIEADNGDLIVLANRDVEKKWVQESAGPESQQSGT
jgi:small-conductance mechanosensitive channel